MCRVHTGGLLLQADEELLKLTVGDLPGVGWQMQKKLEKLGLPTVADIRNSRRELLQRELGAKSGSMASCPLLFGLHLSNYMAVLQLNCSEGAGRQALRLDGSAGYSLDQGYGAAKQITASCTR